MSALLLLWAGVAQAQSYDILITGGLVLGLQRLVRPQRGH